MAIEQLGVNLRLDGAFLDLLFAFFVEGVALLERLVAIFGINRRYEGDMLAIGRPDAVARFAANLRQLSRFAAGKVDHPQLIVAAAIRLEEDVFAIGRPARMTIFFGGSGELTQFALVGSSQPEGRGNAIGVEIDDADDVDDEFAVGTDLRIANALEAKEIVDGHGPFALGEDGSGGG